MKVTSRLRRLLPESREDIETFWWTIFTLLVLVAVISWGGVE